MGFNSVFKGLMYIYPKSFKLPALLIHEISYLTHTSPNETSANVLSLLPYWYFYAQLLCCPRARVVGIATLYGMDGPVIESRRGARDFLSSSV